MEVSLPHLLRKDWVLAANLVQCVRY